MGVGMQARSLVRCAVWASGAVISGRRWIVPGPGLPAGLRVLASNNNLDLAWHDGRLFFAWRTAPVHFAHRDAAIHVVVSDDLGMTWQHEHTFAFGRDVREPRFVEWDGRLLLYCFTAGVEGHRFEPDRVQLPTRSRRPVVRTGRGLGAGHRRLARASAR